MQLQIKIIPKHIRDLGKYYFMSEKKFKIPGDQLKELIIPMGACFATDKITVEGLLVVYMYREAPDFNEDSGWRFMSGTEDEEYADNPANIMIYDVNTVVNYDPAIIPYLHLEVGTQLERNEDNTFTIVK
jgi:hypothetical protein